MDPPAEIQSELESFRAKWRAEVASKGSRAEASESQAGPSTARPRRKPEASLKKSAPRHELEDADEFTGGHVYEELPPETLPAEEGDGASTGTAAGEPQTALEFYEHAADREATGKLGDSLRLYRKAFRMDDSVDKAYKDKHFPGRWKPPPAIPPNAPAPAPGAAQHSSDASNLSLPDLIASFAGLSVQGAPPAVEGMPPPPCPISDLPDEILIHILRDVAVLDVGDFVRLSQVCKKFAHLVATEDRIWRRVCLGSEFGFGGMAYHWRREITWEDLDPAQELADEEDVWSMDELEQRRAQESEAATHAFFRSLYSMSWQTMWRRRPRLRFNGCYISTVNYIRQGQASGHQVTWNSPVHIVTYYRYLRFFRDGSAISLLTTDEPAHVVHHLTKQNVTQHRGHGASSHLPSAVMAGALKGRWRLASSRDHPCAGADPADVEGDVFVETEGIGPKYMYRLEMALKSGGRSHSNNKLVWKAFYNYNRLTDDWGEFALKNDKAFYFSRVKSYGARGDGI